MGIFDFLGGGDSGFDNARDNVARNRKMYEDIKLPNYLQFSPELYTPETANYETLSEDPMIRSSQMALLSKMAGLSETGMSDADAAGYAKARQLGNQVAKSGNQAAMNDAQLRGVGGSGLEFAMREAANQSGAERSNQSGLAQASDSARNRMLYSQAFGDALGSVRGQDLNHEQANKGIINRFNEINTNNRNQANLGNVNARNQAFQYNEGLKDKNYQNQIGRVDKISGMNNEQARIAAAEEEQRGKKKSGMGGLVGGIAGGMIGGPAGASVGAGIGQAIF